MKPKKKMARRTCFCGAEIPPRRGRLYCSDECRATAARVARHAEAGPQKTYGQTVCAYPYCGRMGKPFTRRRPWARYDTERCRTSDWQRLNRRVYQADPPGTEVEA